MLADVQIELREDVTVARLSGEVDASNAPGFTKQLKDAVPNSAIGIVLDLSATTYIDSSGLHLIFDLADALRRRQQVLQLVVAPDTFLADVVGAVNLTGTARISPTLPEALEAIHEPAF
jgi:anti-anti-sigma factor